MWQELSYRGWGRPDDITKVKGVLLAPTSMEEVIRSIPELEGEYEIVGRKRRDLDDMLLQVEVPPDTKREREPILCRLKHQLRVKPKLGYRMEVHSSRSLARHD